MTSTQPNKPTQQTFTAAYKAQNLAEFDTLPEVSPERVSLVRKEKLYHSHLEHWRKQQESGTLPSSAGKPAKDGQSAELARLRSENKNLKAKNESLTVELRKTKTALYISEKHSRCSRTSLTARTPARTEPSSTIISPSWRSPPSLASRARSFVNPAPACTVSVILCLASKSLASRSVIPRSCPSTSVRTSCPCCTLLRSRTSHRASCARSCWMSASTCARRPPCTGCCASAASPSSVSPIPPTLLRRNLSLSLTARTSSGPVISLS